MAGVAHKAQHEFWQPPAAESVAAEVPRSPVRPAPYEICAACATEYLAGASFCHSCGVPRAEATGKSGPLYPAQVYQQMKIALGLSGAALVAFLIGIGCIGIALVGGATYSPQAYPDFPAIMLWRMQWLVGAMAAFVAGILLNSPAPPK